jgi:hypothetical protein
MKTSRSGRNLVAVAPAILSPVILSSPIESFSPDRVAG